MPDTPALLRTRQGLGPGQVSDDRQQLGRRGEEVARSHLQARGYRILEASYRTREGEIDLVAEHDGALVFVEVRTRTGAAVGSPEESVTPVKRSHLVAAAQEYLQTHHADDRDWRIDLVAIELAPGRGLERIDVIRNAGEL